MAGHASLRTPYIPFTPLPIFLWAVGFCCELLSVCFARPTGEVAFLCISIGTAMALLLAVIRRLDYGPLLSLRKTRRQGLVHAGLMIAVILLFAISSWRLGLALDASTVPYSAVLTTAAGLASLAMARPLGLPLVAIPAAANPQRT